MLADFARRPENDPNDRYCLGQTFALADLNDRNWVGCCRKVVGRSCHTRTTDLKADPQVERDAKPMVSRAKIDLTTTLKSERKNARACNQILRLCFAAREKNVTGNCL